MGSGRSVTCAVAQHVHLRSQQGYGTWLFGPTRANVTGGLWSRQTERGAILAPAPASGPLDPHGGVVEHRAAIGPAGIGRGDGVDADPGLEVAVRPDALDDHDALLLTGLGLGMDD